LKRRSFLPVAFFAQLRLLVWSRLGEIAHTRNLDSSDCILYMMAAFRHICDAFVGTSGTPGIVGLLVSVSRL
jgi:hypothetical protein